MAKPAIPSADDISDSEFQSYLERYPACLEAISESKRGRAGPLALTAQCHSLMLHDSKTRPGNTRQSRPVSLRKGNRLLRLWRCKRVHGS